MVFCGIYPIDGDEFPALRDALEKLQLNDASFTYEPESSTALGFGFRCGFLGLLHMEIVRERLEREFDLSLIATAPSVGYRRPPHRRDDAVRRQSLGPAAGPEHRPHRRAHAEGHDPHARRVRRHGHGPVPDAARAPGPRWSTSPPNGWSSSTPIPLAEVVIDFFDQLKSRTKGYASLDYEPGGYATANLVKVDLLHQPRARRRVLRRSSTGPTPTTTGGGWPTSCASSSRARCSTCPSRRPIGGRVIARETVKARRKDVLAKCYGGDITRKRKLLEKQKEGKKRMKNIGRVEVPQEAFVSALRLDE